MIKVLVVDDEILVRTGIKTTISWADNGFELIGDASNGVDALELFRKRNPEIVITDIKMPKMDGIELTRCIRKENNKVKVIILTCYDEFNYAKEAIRLGASDYIVKSTMEPDQLLSVLRRIRSQILLEKADMKTMEEMRDKIEKQSPLVTQKALVDFLNGLSDESEYIQARLVSCGADPGKAYGLLYCKIDGFGKVLRSSNTAQSNLIKASVRNISEQMLTNPFHGIIAETDQEGYACLIWEDSSRNIVKKAGLLAKKIIKAVKSYTSVTVSVAIGRSTDSIEQIPEIFDEIKGLMRYKLFYGYECLLSFDSVQIKDHILMEGTLDQEDALCDNLDAGDPDSVREIVTEIFSPLHDDMKSLSLLDFISMQMIYILNKYIKEYSCEGLLKRNKTYFTVEEVYACETLNEIEEWFAEKFEVLSQYIQRHRYNTNNPIVRKAMEYVSRQYAKRITLKEVADHVNVSRNYLSQIFKQDSGENFVEYLNHVRIEHAKKYLKLTTMKTYEIAYEVGYKDKTYFSKIFKQIEGCTPSEYRVSGKP